MTQLEPAHIGYAMVDYIHHQSQYRYMGVLFAGTYITRLIREMGLMKVIRRIERVTSLHPLALVFQGDGVDQEKYIWRCLHLSFWIGVRVWGKGGGCTSPTHLLYSHLLHHQVALVVVPMETEASPSELEHPSTWVWDRLVRFEVAGVGIQEGQRIILTIIETFLKHKTTPASTTTTTPGLALALMEDLATWDARSPLLYIIVLLSFVLVMFVFVSINKGLSLLHFACLIFMILLYVSLYVFMLF